MPWSHGSKACAPSANSTSQSSAAATTPRAFNSSENAGLIRFAHPAGRPSAQSVSLRSAVERTFSWLDKSRRLSRDYEQLPDHSESHIYVCMSRLMLKRLARK